MGNYQDSNTCQRYSTDTTGDQKEWMKNLHDSKIISKVIIPGTHGSCTYRGNGGDMYQTQVWDIKTQLNNGIRFFDVQVYVNDGNVSIYHFNRSQNVDFTRDLIDPCSAFLLSHPSEFILIMVRTPWEIKDVERSILNICSVESFWLNREIPTVREVRGKMVLLRKYSGSRGISVYDSMNLYYNPSVRVIFDCNENGWKWNEIKQALETPLRNIDPNKIECTYVVASGWWTYPTSAAYRLNKCLNSYLQKTRVGILTRNLGCVVLDYPSCEIIQRILSLNEMGGE